MRFRAVATAVAVWCASGAAMASGYSEVWNPPEAAAHGKHGAAKGRAKSAAKHVASAGAAKSKTGVKHVASAGANKASGLASGRAKPKSAGVADAAKRPAQVVQTKSDHAKAIHANIAQGQSAHGGVVKVAGTAKGAAARPAPADHKTPALAANTSADQLDAVANPATARSGSLPPILH
jgi:hypothetical protein